MGQHDAPSRRRPPGRRGAYALAATGVLLVALGAVALSAHAIVRGRLLTTDTYTGALAENHAYQRVYTDVLTDPQVRDFTWRLLGDLTVPSNRGDIFAVSEAVLRTALPPRVIRDLVEDLVNDTLAYLRGDTASLQLRAELSAVLSSLDESVGAFLGAELATAAGDSTSDLRVYQEAVRDFARSVVDGRIPAELPFLSATPSTTRDEIVRAIDAATRDIPLSSRARDQIVAAIYGGDERDALITASTDLLRPHLRSLRLELTQTGALEVDLLNYLREQIGDPEPVLAQLASVRDAARYVPPWLRPAGLLAVAAGVTAILVGLRHRSVLALAVLGGSGIVAAGATHLTWRAVASVFDSPVATAIGHPSADLPVSAHALLVDVTDSISVGLDDAVEDVASGFLIVGVVACSVAIVAAAVRAYLARPVGSPVFLGVLVLVATTAWAGSERVLDDATGHPARQCNGHVELCDRPYDEVVQAATHNSMSSPDAVYVWPEHDAGIREQLESGVRTLLVDTSYWNAASPAALDAIREVVPPELATALYGVVGDRLRAREGTFLCHARCAFGAVELVSALTRIREFLDGNPHEVVTLVIQNGITTEDTIDAFEISGLLGYVYEGTPDDTWPSLGELIDSGQRLVVFAEDDGPPPDWYHDARRYISGTSFDVGSADQLSCELTHNRADAPLIRLNHWIDRAAPDRADAAVLNRRDVIVSRARACAAVHGRLPNFVVVNFFSMGDLIGAVDELNGMGHQR